MHPFLKFPDGASVVVTGAGGGIGRATARICAEVGLRVALWDVALTSVESLSEELTHGGATTFVAEVDVLDAADIAAGFAATQRAFGHIDYLVNNAGPTNATAVSFAEGLVMAAGSTANVTSAWLALGRREGDAVVNVASVAGNITGAAPNPGIRQPRPPSPVSPVTSRCAAPAAFAPTPSHRVSSTPRAWSPS